ncbi:MAG: trypsin-like peptidase domain-containing protein [Candidatus Metalachnospira sp.]|nr:trypsin-like peptidase domain-containing protein [Candidatus Metalachnospira sp.]
MSWYEETSKNNENDNKNKNEGVGMSKVPNDMNDIQDNEERTVNADGYIDTDDTENKEEKIENVYDRPFVGTASERIDSPVSVGTNNTVEQISDEKKASEMRIGEPSGNDNSTASNGSDAADGGETPKGEKTPYYDVKVKPKKQGMTFGKVVAVCLVVSLGLGTGIGAGYGVSRIFNKTENVSSDGVLTTSAAAVSATKSNSAADAIDSVYNAVVSITTLTQGTANYGLYSVPYQAEGAGSGVIFSEDDSRVFVATNQHVIDSASNIAIAFDDAENTIPATIVGYDETSDLAVLSVDKSDLESQGITNVTIAVFDDTDSIKLGESVIAIGNSLGEGKTTTGGMISAENKAVNVEGKELNVIQTDAAINPGNSGGALVNYSGAVIGINTAKTFATSSGSTAEGVGYAIPASVAVPILNELKENGSIEKPYLGITGQDITSQLSDLYRLPVGVLVTSVMDGSSAQQAGIQQGDVIVSYNDKTVLNMDNLVQFIEDSKVGDQVKLGIIRNGDTSVEVTTTLGNINAQPSTTQPSTIQPSTIQPSTPQN